MVFHRSVIALASFTLFIFATMLSGSKSYAVELIMIEQAHCPWCEKWDEEIGDMYHKTDEGKFAPLRRVDMFHPLPDDLQELKLGSFTPTFVLWDQGKEVGRLRGYAGDEFFWGLLDELLQKLPGYKSKLSPTKVSN